MQNQYQRYLQLFVDFCKESGESWPPRAEDLDPLLPDYMDLLYLQGRGPQEGEKTVAAVEYNFIAAKGNMFRAKRALKGWRKVSPAQSRPPLPRVAMFGGLMNLLAAGLHDMALMTLVAFFLCLRPGEAIDLKGTNMIKPVKSAGLQFQWVRVAVREQEGGRPDKVGVYDNCIPFDLPSMHWIGDLLLQKAKALPKNKELIFQFSMGEYRKQFSKAASFLGLNGFHPYQLRHGGATEDMTSGARDHNSIKSRGRWRTDPSVRRYAKVGRVQELLNQISPRDIQFCTNAEKRVQRVFLGQSAARFSHL